MFSEVAIDQRGIVVFRTETAIKYYVSNHGGETRRPIAAEIRGKTCTFTFESGEKQCFNINKQDGKVVLTSQTVVYKLSPHDFFAQPFVSDYEHITKVDKTMYYVDEGGRTHDFTVEAEIVRIGGIYMIYRDSVLSPIEPKPCGSRFYYSVTGISVNVVNFMVVKTKAREIFLAGQYMHGIKKIAFRNNTAFPIYIETNFGGQSYAINRKYQLEAESGECVDIFDNNTVLHYTGDNLYTIGGSVYTRVSSDCVDLSTFDSTNYWERGVFKLGRSYICQMVSKPCSTAIFTLVYAK